MKHDVIHNVRTPVRLNQSSTVYTDEVADLTAVHVRVWRIAAGEYLPEQHTCATKTTHNLGVPSILRFPNRRTKNFLRNTRAVTSHNVIILRLTNQYTHQQLAHGLCAQLTFWQQSGGIFMGNVWGFLWRGLGALFGGVFPGWNCPRWVSRITMQDYSLYIQR